jgi:hypothetical protein
MANGRRERVNRDAIERDHLNLKKYIEHRLMMIEVEC